MFEGQKAFLLFLLLCPQLYLCMFTMFGEIFVHVLFFSFFSLFNPTICWVCFCCQHSPVQDMNVRYLESLQWNACVHRLDLGLYSHPKEWGMESEPMLTPRGKPPLLEAQRRVEPAMLHHARQLAQHSITTNWATLALVQSTDWLYNQRESQWVRGQGLHK